MNEALQFIFMQKIINLVDTSDFNSLITVTFIKNNHYV